MRNATILVIRLRGTATEAIKNIVLAGIGKLVIYDSEEVKEEDLGAGFFFRDEDVGKKVLQSSILADFLWLFTGGFSFSDREWMLRRLE
jgi:ubiquitin-like 1-activating enzyme E1 A